MCFWRCSLCFPSLQRRERQKPQRNILPRRVLRLNTLLRLPLEPGLGGRLFGGPVLWISAPFSDVFWLLHCIHGSDVEEKMEKLLSF